MLALVPLPLAALWCEHRNFYNKKKVSRAPRHPRLHQQTLMSKDEMYKISITVATHYIEEQSLPEQNRYVFAYTIRIRNNGAKAAKLLARHWVITDANGKIDEVFGEGVVGKQPYLNPGEEFQYTSGAVIATPVGTMHGNYDMQANDGVRFAAHIPPFTLAVPRLLH